MNEQRFLILHPPVSEEEEEMRTELLHWLGC